MRFVYTDYPEDTVVKCDTAEEMVTVCLTLAAQGFPIEYRGGKEIFDKVLAFDQELFNYGSCVRISDFYTGQYRLDTCNERFHRDSGCTILDFKDFEWDADEPRQMEIDDVSVESLLFL